MGIFPMPRRTTHYYTSNNAQPVSDEKLYTYYCKYSGIHAITTSVEICKLPRRKTDNSIILDRDRYTVRLYTTDGGVKYLKRDDKVEKQFRKYIGQLPVAYTTTNEAR